MNTHKQLISLRLPKRSSFSTALLAGAVSLALGLTACGPNETAASGDSSSPIGAEVDTEEVAAKETGEETQAAKIYVEDGVAIGGADPVAYFSAADEGDFVAGSAEYAYEWKGATWQFASAENRDAFAADPEQYAPQYGGHCAWAAAQDAIAAIDPSAWKVVDGKLYLNLNKKIQARWEEDVSSNIAKADTNWPELAAQ